MIGKLKLEVLKKLLDKQGIYSNTNLEKIDKVCIDSREVIENSLFFAINKGNNFVEEVIKKGGLVICDSLNYKDKNIQNVVYVENTVEFIKQYAKEYRKKLKSVIIAITGSNGKTSVKDILSELLSVKYKVHKTYKNYNNHIGAPLTILQANEDHEFIVIELGTSSMGEINTLGQIIKPDYSIITNIGESHLEYFKTRENILKEKSSIIKHTKNLVLIDIEDSYLETLVEKYKEKLVAINLKNISAEAIMFHAECMSFTINLFDYTSRVITNLNGVHNVNNILFAMGLIKILFYDDDIEPFTKKLSDLKLSEMRFEILHLDKMVVVNDAYNASYTSTSSSIKTFSKVFPKHTKVLVLGSMLELGEKSEVMHLMVLDEILLNNIEYLILIGKETMCIADYISKYRIPLNLVYIDIDGKTVARHYNILKNSDDICLYGDKTVEQLKKDSERSAVVNYIKELSEEHYNLAVLFKGSRGMKLEEIVKKLSE